MTHLEALSVKENSLIAMKHVQDHVQKCLLPARDWAALKFLLSPPSQQVSARLLRDAAKKLGAEGQAGEMPSCSRLA